MTKELEIGDVLYVMTNNHLNRHVITRVTSDQAMSETHGTFDLFYNDRTDIFMIGNRFSAQLETHALELEFKMEVLQNKICPRSW